MNNGKNCSKRPVETITRRVMKIHKEQLVQSGIGEARPSWQGELFKDAIWLLAQSPEHKYMFLADLHWAIMPPFRLNQYRVFYQGDTPIASVCWAKVNDVVLTRLMKLGPRIRPREWDCGEHIVIMWIVTPFGGQAQAREDVEHRLFSGKTVYWIHEFVASAG
jgi:cytolysin-activating lysine-acyltransferase